MAVSLIVTYHSKVGRLEDKSLYDLVNEAGKVSIEAGEILRISIRDWKDDNSWYQRSYKNSAMASYWPKERSEGMIFLGLFAGYAKGYQKRHNFSDE